MLEPRHFENSDNLRLLRPHDYGFGRAAVRFTSMVADGSAWPHAVNLTPSGLPPLTQPRNEYPSNDAHAARISIWRARRQFTKGNITADDLHEIIVRCTAMIAKAES